MSPLAYLFAGGVGLILGLLGGGGSILTVPVFIYVLHAQPKAAIAMSVPVVGVTSLVGAWGHWRQGHVEIRQALLFGTFAMVGSYLGASAAVFVPGSAQLVLLSLLMVAAALSMLRRTSAIVAKALNPRPPLDIYTRGAGGAAGFVIGALTGLVGIGGGFLFVPALVLLAGVSIKDAIGTSLLVIAMSSFAALIGYAGQTAIPWRLVALFLLSASGGILAGVYLMRFIPPRPLQRGFAVLLLLIASLMLAQNLAGLSSGISEHLFQFGESLTCCW
jgi:uncharacterized protein